MAPNEYISFFEAKTFLSEKFGKTPTDADFWMWGFFGKESGGIDAYLGKKNRDGKVVFRKNSIAGSHQFDSISRCINDSILFRSFYLFAELEQFQPVWYITADELLKRWTERFDDEGNAKSYIEQYATEWADYDDLVPRLRNQFVGANPGVKTEFEPFAGVYLFEDVLSVEKYADFPPEKFASSGLTDYSPNPQTQTETVPELHVDAVGDVESVFAGLSNLRSNEISLVVLDDHNAKIVIRRKTFTVSSAQLGLKANSQGWKLLQSAALSSGDLSQGLKRFNTSSDLKNENAKIKTIVCRLRKKLVKAMGLIDDPIPYQPNGSWKFAFKLMTHKLLSGSNATKGSDAMDYVSTECDDNQNESSNWDENEY